MRLSTHQFWCAVGDKVLGGLLYPPLLNIAKLSDFDRALTIA